MKMSTSRGAAFVHLVVVSIAVVAAWGTAHPSSPQKAPVADKKPAEAKDLEVIDGARYKELIEARHGKPVMVSFWATWCEPCRDEYPMVVDLARQNEAKGLVVIGVSLDEDAETGLVRRFLARTAPGFLNFRKKPGGEEAFINLVDSQWSGALPATLFYTRDGHLAAKIVGEATRDKFEAAIQKILQ
jgi:thiol-disulfide isomerase/thioredoxin